MAGPGRGAPARVTLTGLSFATSYRVWVTAVADDGQRAQASVDLTTAGIPKTATAAVDGAAGALLLNGQPFLPFMVWSQCPGGYAADLAAGINLFAENPCGGLQDQLDGLAGRAFSAAVAGQSPASGSGLIGYFYPDEPDGLGLTAAALPPPPAGVTGPRFMTLTNHFYSGAAQLENGRQIYQDLIARADVVGFDLYPLQGWCLPGRLGDVYDSQTELVRLAAQKPTFQWIESADWQCPGGATAVTPATVRAESWLAIAGGAHGLGFFPATFPSSNAAAIAAVVRDVAKLGPALLSPFLPATADNPQLRAGGRSYDGALYVIVVNAGYSAAGGTITVPGLGGRSLDVLDEGRRLGANGDSFSDSFPPLGVRVYVAPPVEG